MLVAAVPETLFFIFYEICILFSSMRLVYFISIKTKKVFSNSELIIGWTSLSIILSVIISTIFSFIESNGAFEYIITSVFLVSLLHIGKKSELSIYWKNLHSTFYDIVKNTLNWRIITIFSLTLPLVLGMMRPLSDPDSTWLANYMLGWAFNQSTPYSNWADYVPMWQLSYMPSMIITHTDNFLWFNSLKPLIIIGLGTNLIGREIGLSKNLRWMTIFTGILYFVIWQSWGDIGTLKDDYILAGGLILIVLAILRTIRKDFNIMNKILLILGFVFVTSKFFGIFVVVFSTILFILFNRHEISKAKKTFVLWGVLSFLVIFAINGHYYIHNFVKFGNPFYPFKITFLGIGFNGPFDGTGTSILSHIGEQRLWDILVPTSQISVGGIFFPLTLAFGTLGMIGIISFSFFRFIKTRKIEPTLVFFSTFIFFTWMLYLNSVISAGAIPASLDFISGLNNTRYVLGTIFLTELFFTYILFRLKIPKIVIFAVIIINWASRLYIAYYRLPHNIDYQIIIIPFMILVGFAIFDHYYFKRSSSLKIVIACMLGLSIFFVGPQVLESNRVEWVPFWHNVVLEIYHLPPSEIYVISGHIIDKGNIWPVKYPVLGDGFHNKLTIGTEENLISDIKGEKIGYPQYVVKLCDKTVSCKSEINVLEAEIVPYGYKVIATDSHAILLKFEK